MATGWQLAAHDLADLHAQVASWAGDRHSEVRVAAVRAKPGRGVVVGYRLQSHRFSVARGPCDGHGTLTAHAGSLPGPVELSDPIHDRALPGLAAVLELAPGVIAWVRSRCGGEAVAAQLVRYKPRQRCVVRFQLADGGQVFGKLFADPVVAAQADAVHQELWQATTAGHPRSAGHPTMPAGCRPWLARPLGVDPGLAMTLVEGVAGASPGTATLLPGLENPYQTRDLAAVGRLLARLHATVPRSALPVRDPATEQRRLRDRAAALHRWLPVDGVRAAAASTAEALSALPTGLPVVTHGAFKPSQLLLGADGAVVVDLDDVAMGDPARDVGYLFAYLRPHRLLSRGGPWPAYAQTVAVVEIAYRDECARLGVPDDEVERRTAAARIYQAATLFKIAHRRVNRLQSPRPGELSVLVGTVAQLMMMP